MNSIVNLFYLVRIRAGMLLMVMACLVVATGLESLSIGSVYPLVDLLLNPSAGEKYARYIEHVPFLSIPAEKMFSFMMALILSLFFVKNALLMAFGFLEARIVQTFRAGWKCDIFEALLSQPYCFFTDHSTGDLTQQQMEQTNLAANAVLSLINVLKSVLTIISIYVLLCYISFKITAIISLVAVALVVFFVMISRVRMYGSGEELNALYKTNYQTIVDALSGIREVKSYVRETYFLNKFKAETSRIARTLVKIKTFQLFPAPMTEIMAVCGMLALILLVRHLTAEGQAVLPVLAVVSGALYKLVPQVSGLASNIMGLTSSLASVVIVADLRKRNQGIPAKLTSPKYRFQELIEIERVNFAYSPEQPVLHDLKMQFAKGKFYGIAGPSGSGKSTLVDLLIGFYKPSSGVIRVDGRDLSAYDLYGWRQTVGVISQETFIFNGTIAENISFSANANHSGFESVESAARIADAHNFITDLDDGYDTRVGERGAKLSGGQRQRVSIARAVYADTDILIFDEATSSLDALSEREVQQAIEGLSRQKTIIVIAHRLATIKNADHIYVMDQGRIVEEGVHEALKQKGGLYSLLCSQQGV